ncbi:MAG: DUF2752 domain-containing protein [Phycisphaerae bacterium]
MADSATVTPAPPARPIRARRGCGWRVRATYGAVSIICAGVLSLAVWLRPDVRGFGTHEQMHLPPCGFMVTSGLPCPTCGMTTSFSLMMHGHPLAAVIAQPAGAVLCLAAVAGMITAMIIAVSGRVPRVNWDRIGPVRLVMGVGILLMGGWGFKIAHGLLTGALPAR